MHTLSVNHVIDWNPPFTERMTELVQMFGLRMTRLRGDRLRHRCRLNIKPGQICCIIGGSGAGKTVLLNAIYDRINPADRICLDRIPLSTDKSLIDSVDGSVCDAARTLNQAGFSDIFAMLKTPALLSTGQQWRYRLAQAITGGRQWIFADDFTASQDRITAGVIAYKLRKLTDRTDKIVVLATCHEDILIDLRPDVIVTKYSNGTSRIIYMDKSQDDLHRPVNA